MGRHRFAAIVAAAAILAFASTAFAETHVELRGDAAQLDGTKLDDLVALELGADASHVVRITVDVARARANVDLEVDGEHRRASLGLTEAEPERALALFVGELARGTVKPEQVEPVKPADPPRKPSEPPKPIDASIPTPAPRELRVAVLGAMGVRVTTARGHVLPSPHVEIAAAKDDSFRIGGTLRYAYASASDALGSVHDHLVGGGATGTWVLASGSTFALATGPRVEVGIGLGAGSDAPTHVTTDDSTAFVVTGAWEVELHVKLGGLAIVGSIEGGTFLRGVELHADDRDVLHLAGPFVGAGLGLGL